ncbi:hypothetical protein N7537_010586 [Penicillium hordei]|uniref:RTA1 domain protein n=1 Tax=Penicillium hordei TaxID=40994 RepID=A0AAD6DWE1_9EURO|nr:uncharacterized protein N7537_010586 [Penicillium hordei]KAJ5593682.1 hypothetical protein N7537_010586 [Penicillium hordei]
MVHADIMTRGEADFDLYMYNPSATAGWIFVALFGICTLVHLFYIFSLRAWFFIPFVLGCIGMSFIELPNPVNRAPMELTSNIVGETFGYYGRAWSHNNIRDGTPYLIQMMLILGSAPLLAASIYMTLGRYIRALDAEHHAIIRTRWLTKIYVAIDIISFVCQIMGSAAQASGNAEGMETGIHLVLGGLGFQLVAFLCFIAMSAVLQIRLQSSPTEPSARFFVSWKNHMWALYLVSVLVFVRSLYRFIEFAAGAGTIMVNSEVCLYLFDASLFFLVAVCLAVVHPASLIKSIAVKQGERLIRDSESYIPLHGRN